MLTKMRKMVKGQEGFTLIELITVLVILAVIMAIGIPKYMQIQAQSEWETDKSTLTSFAKVAEIYSAQNGHVATVSIKDLTDAGMIDGDTLINRGPSGAIARKKISTYTEEKYNFSIDSKTGMCTGLSTTIGNYIGVKEDIK